MTVHRKTGRNDFEHWKTRNVGYFMLVNCEQDIRICVYPGFHLYVQSRAEDKLTMSKNSKMEEVVVHKILLFMFVGHGYVKHAAVG